MNGGDSGLEYNHQGAFISFSHHFFLHISKVSPEWLQQFQTPHPNKVTPRTRKERTESFLYLNFCLIKEKKYLPEASKKMPFLASTREGHGTICRHYGRITRKARFWHFSSQSIVGLLAKEGREEDRQMGRWTAPDCRMVLRRKCRGKVQKHDGREPPHRFQMAFSIPMRDKRNKPMPAGQA